MVWSFRRTDFAHPELASKAGAERGRLLPAPVPKDHLGAPPVPKAKPTPVPKLLPTSKGSGQIAKVNVAAGPLPVVPPKAPKALPKKTLPKKKTDPKVAKAKASGPLVKKSLPRRKLK